MLPNYSCSTKDSSEIHMLMGTYLTSGQPINHTENKVEERAKEVASTYVLRHCIGMDKTILDITLRNNVTII